jgi:hypothetical protein
MREQEMRERVFGFLKARMRGMIFPATVGIGLAVSGCSESKATPAYMASFPQDAAQNVVDARVQDVAPVTPDLPVADANNPQLPESQPVDGTDVPPAPLDQAVALDTDEASDSAPAIDSSDSHPTLDTSPADTGHEETGIIITKYLAPLPDGGRDGLRLTLYAAPMPGAV